VRRPAASPHVTVDPNPQILSPSPFAPVRRRIAIFSVVATALLMNALGLFASIFSIGSIMGPIFGGLFVTYWTWRGIFFVNVPIGALLSVLCLRFVPRDPERTAEHRAMDMSGMVLLGVGVLALMTGISYLGEAGTRVWSPLFLAPTMIGVLGLAQFGRHIRRVANPFVAPLLIAGRGFAAVNVINLLTGAVFGMMALVPLYAVDRYRISALGSAWGAGWSEAPGRSLGREIVIDDERE
jgi:MFS family permease